MDVVGRFPKNLPGRFARNVHVYFAGHVLGILLVISPDEYVRVRRLPRTRGTISHVILLLFRPQSPHYLPFYVCAECVLSHLRMISDVCIFWVVLDSRPDRFFSVADFAPRCLFSVWILFLYPLSNFDPDVVCIALLTGARLQFLAMRGAVLKRAISYSALPRCRLGMHWAKALSPIGPFVLIRVAPLCYAGRLF